MKISQQIVIDGSDENSEKKHHQTIHKPQIIRERKKTINFGVKERGSRLFKYLQEKQRAFSNYQPEEDRILEILVRKLGPDFSRISKYFPAKTIHMLKNRYYKYLRHNQPMVIDFEKEFLEQDKSRIESKRILNIWPDKSNEMIESSPLFPEAKELIHKLFSHFRVIIEKTS